MLTIEKNDELMQLRADELAHSGAYRSWCAIETRLRYEGFIRTRRLLADQARRDQLDTICRDARRVRLTA